MNIRRAQYRLAILVSFITALIYLPVLRNGFVIWDDDQYIINNQHIRSLGAGFFRWAFTDMSVDYWQPVSWISHALDYALWGMNPMGHHLTSLVLHAGNTFFVVCLVVRLLEAARSSLYPSLPGGDTGIGLSSLLSDRQILITAGVTGVLFGLHPLHVESAVWVTERKDLLCALFFLLSIMTYLSYRADKSYKSYFLSLVLFILALASKPMAVSLPFVLLILDFYPFNRFASSKALLPALAEKIPFFLLSLGLSVMTLLQQETHGAIITLQVVPFHSRLIGAAYAMCMYLRKMVIPLDLLPSYPNAPGVSLSSPEYLSATVFVCVVTAACIFLIRKQRLWPSVWGYYFVTLLPVLGLIQVGSVSMADRFTYLPSLGPFLLTGLGVALAWTRAGDPGHRSMTVKRVIAIAGIIIFIGISWLTLKQIAIWKNTVSLWSYVIEKAPLKVPIAYFNRGLVFAREGQFDRALEDFSAAIFLSPSYAEAYMNRGAALGATGRFYEAIKDLDTAVKLGPESVQAFINRGLAYESVGRNDLAIKDYTRVLILSPDFVRAYMDRGNLYLETRSPELAEQDFQRACDLGSAEGCSALGMTKDSRKSDNNH